MKLCDFNCTAVCNNKVCNVVTALLQFQDLSVFMWNGGQCEWNSDLETFIYIYSRLYTIQLNLNFIVLVASSVAVKMQSLRCNYENLELCGWFELLCWLALWVGVTWISNPLVWEMEPFPQFPFKDIKLWKQNIQATFWTCMLFWFKNWSKDPRGPQKKNCALW